MSPYVRPEHPLLLVEDNAGDADLIREYLADSGLAPSGVVHVDLLAGAVRALRAQDFGAVLLDLRLPDAVGLDCVAAIRTIAEVPIVVLTGMDDEALALACLQAGAQDYLAKQDLRPQHLRRSIAYAIVRSREEQERLRADRLQARMAAIVEASSDAIISATAAGVVTTWNLGATKLFGHSAEQALGRSVEALLPAVSEDEPSLGALLFREVAEGVADLDWRRPDGSFGSLSVAACNLRDAEGEQVALAAICRDTSDVRRRDLELRHRNEELRARDAQMRALADRLNVVREEERTRISRVVHDELGQLLTGIKMDLRWISKRLKPEEPAPAEALLTKLSEAEALADQTIETVQRVAIELRPSALDALGLAAALRDEARRFSARSGVETTVVVDDPKGPPPGVATQLFRIFQELLTNVARHAQAQRVRVSLKGHEAAWLLQVEDDGIGFEHPVETGFSSLGLLGISERAASLGGTLELRRGSTGGTVATVQVTAP